jgi:PKD domain-containing protein
MRPGLAPAVVILTGILFHLGCRHDGESGHGTNAPAASPLAPTAVPAAAKPGTAPAGSSSATSDVPPAHVLGPVSSRITRNVEFPPRNEPFEFRTQALEQQYVSMGRTPAQYYTDVEGTIVWTQEYLRYRVNQCGHEDAVQKVLAQIGGGGIAPTCGSAPRGRVAFPPRNEPFDFRNQLEDYYKNVLHRSLAAPTAVDVEGDIVWTQEYLRYRVSSCSHEDAVQKVLSQIRGGGIASDCTPRPTGPVTEPPQAVLVAPSQCTVNVSCQFNGANSTGSALTYSWSFGDGLSASGPIVTHSYGIEVAPPFSTVTKKVTLTVKDNSGRKSSTSANVSVFREY